MGEKFACGIAGMCCEVESDRAHTYSEPGLQTVKGRMEFKGTAGARSGRSLVLMTPIEVLYQATPSDESTLAERT